MSRGTTSEWMALCSASWSEGSRARAAELDVEHVLAGIMASGGEAARLLGQAGVTLEGVRAAAHRVRRREVQMLGVETSGMVDLPPRPIDDLHHEKTGDIPMSTRYEALLTGKASSALEVLRRVVDDPSGRGRLVLEEAGADVDVVRRVLDVTEPAGRRWHAVPVRRDILGDGPVGRAVQVRRFVSAPPDVVVGVVASDWFAERYLGSADKKGYRFRPALLDGQVADARGGRRVVWVMRVSGGRKALDDAVMNYTDVLVSAAPGGSDVTVTVASRIWGGLRGRIVAALMPFTLLSRARLWQIVWGLSLKTAEVLDD